MAQPPQKIGTGQPGRPPADNRDSFARFRCCRYRQSFPGIHLIIGNKAFQLIDGHRIIFDSAAAVCLAGVRAYPAAGKQEWIAFPDGVDSAFIVALADLSDVLGDVYFSRAGLTAGRQAIINAIEMHQALGHGFDPHDILGANRFTGPAADTFFCIHHRVPFGSHFNCAELAGSDTVAQPDAADSADPLAPGQSRLRSAGVDAQVNKFIGSSQAAAASVK